MNPDIIISPLNQQLVLDRFVSVCRTDARVIAAFMGGSHARGEADAYSDLDLYLVTTDESYPDFLAQRHAFVRQLGTPVFIETFDSPYMVFYIMAGGAEGELGIGRASQFAHIHSGPYKVLVDKQNLLRAAVFSGGAPDSSEQVEKLRRLIYWFWHDLSHFITAMGRGQLWWAQGQLEALRGYCVNLARLHHDFQDAYTGDEPYFKLENIMPVEQIAALRATLCTLDRADLLKSGLVLVRFYRELAVPLAQVHNIAYPRLLEREMVQRLENLSNTP